MTGSRTRSNQQRIHPLSSLYGQLDGALGTEEVNKLKIVLQGRQISKRDMQTLGGAASIFRQLEDSGFISSVDLTFLKQILEEIDRAPLVELVERCEQDLNEYTGSVAVGTSPRSGAYYFRLAVTVAACSVLCAMCYRYDVFSYTITLLVGTSLDTNDAMSPDYKPPDVVPTPQINIDSLLAKALDSAIGTKGQIKIGNRDIMYEANGRIHSFKEPWVFDAWAMDLQSQIKAKVNHFENEDDAVKEAISELVKKLKTAGIVS